ncbi:MAG TPA: helix-turn-helix transcriptional regulator [Acidobacteriota bacterium]|nr:helix-turn-helix transcriptional regulator [Acidobacteriota bacterium]
MKKEESKVAVNFLNERLKDPAFRKHYRSEQMVREAGEEIARIRKEHRWSVEEMAQRIGVKPADVSRMERGEFRRYTLKLLQDIALATDLQLRVRFSRPEK